MKNNLQKLYNIIILKREIRKLKKQLKEANKQIDLLTEKNKENELNLKFANKRANNFQKKLRKTQKDGCKREKKIKKNER